jgi:PTS system mannose-specific IIB component
MDIGLLRIDSRLLHGQVALTWTKQIRPDRILIVSDKVAKDEMRRALIVQAAPSGVKANVIPIDKFVQVYKNPAFEKVRTLLLFETPQDVKRVYELLPDIDVEEVNLGSMLHTEGKKLLSKAVSVGDDDLKTFKWFKDKGIKIEIRVVPTDKGTDLYKLLNSKGIDL